MSTPLDIVTRHKEAGFIIFYNDPNVGSRVSMHRSIIGLHNSRAVMSNVSTLMDALAEFNTLERTSGFDTGCMVVERQSHDGRLTHRWTCLLYTSAAADE